MTWSQLAQASDHGGFPAELQAALVDELAEELAKFASFLDASRIVVCGDGAFCERIMPTLEREVPLRAGPAGSKRREIVSVQSGSSVIALGAALAPVAAAITRSLEFEAGCLSGDAGARR